jgi:methylmalonyl-CoA mutase
VQLGATVGEVSSALEAVFGRHTANPRMVTGVYAAAGKSMQNSSKKRSAARGLPPAHRPPAAHPDRKMGQDGHDRGARVIASAFADMGFDVDIGPLFQTPRKCARQAIENDVHLCGISTLAGGHKTLVPAIIQALKDQGADDIIVFVGGVIPRQDYDFLYEAGVKGIYGPGTPIPASAKDVLEQIRKAQG